MTLVVKRRLRTKLLLLNAAELAECQVRRVGARHSISERAAEVAHTSGNIVVVIDRMTRRVCLRKYVARIIISARDCVWIYPGPVHPKPLFILCHSSHCIVAVDCPGGDTN